ncbi:hypothetical protein ADK90_03210 [Streptomyces sp. XY413]|nr:hypothetical protein ADK90_03210 [Streptomyces sp. XY413]
MTTVTRIASAPTRSAPPAASWPPRHAGTGAAAAAAPAAVAAVAGRATPSRATVTRAAARFTMRAMSFPSRVFSALACFQRDTTRRYSPALRRARVSRGG